MRFTLPEIHSTKKTAILSDWSEDERGKLQAIINLEIDGAVVEGLYLRITALRSMPDREVMCQLEYSPSFEPKNQLCRIDWKPLRGHHNAGRGPAAYRLREISGSHHHSFKLNWNESLGKMRQPNLPIAVPMDPDPANFRQLLALVSKEFRIAELGDMPLPAWDLLL